MTRLSKLVCLIIFLGIISESFLHLTIDFWPQQLKNMALSKYSDIYYTDPRWSMHMPKPNFKQPRMFYNGYWWRHETNNIGIRDIRNIEKADIVVLGDSMVYGHGVNFEDTLCHYLEQLSGLGVANLGVQADYPPYQYIRLKHLGLFLRPRIVLFFIYGEQDKLDFEIYRPKEDYIERIIAEAPPDYSKGVKSSDYLLCYSKAHFDIFDSVFDLLTRRIFIAEMNILKRYSQVIFTKSYEAADSLRTEKILAEIILDSKNLCASNGARLILVSNPDKNSEFNKVAKKICINNNIPFIDLYEKSPQPNYFLKHDGHYSVDGHRWVAESIVVYCKESGIINDVISPINQALSYNIERDTGEGTKNI